jgi:hypothetical protein
MSHLTPEETARIKEEQRVRTGETVKTVAKMYFTVVGIIIGILVLICVCGIVFFNLNSRTSFPSPSLQSPTTFPSSSLQAQVAEKIKTIYSYKAHGTGKFTDDKGKIVTFQFEDEFVRPNKFHSIETSEDGQVTETIFVGNPYCSRQGDGAWSCNTGFISDEIQGWADIVTGERSFGINTINVVDKGTRTETWNGKECILFYKTQTYTDSNSEETFELCVDSNTLLPVKYAYKGNWPDNPGTKIAYREYNLYDINVPIDISLPVSP